MGEEENKSGGMPFGFKHLGRGVVGLGVNFGEVNSYLPLFKVVSPQESLDLSTHKAFDLLRLGFENETAVIGQINTQVERVMQHVRSKQAPLVKDSETMDKEFKLLCKKAKADRSEEEEAKIDDFIEKMAQKTEQIIDTAGQLGMKTLSEVLSAQDEIALVLIVLGAEGWTKDRNRKNIVEFRLGLMSRDPDSPKKFLVDSLTIAEADVFSDKTVPIIHTPESKTGEEDLGYRDYLPIVVGSTPHKFLEAKPIKT